MGGGKGKMPAGEPYDPRDPQLAAGRRRARSPARAAS
jgi:hypothetical protein